MAQFSKDTDLLKYESRFFMDLAFGHQKLCSGSDGITAGTTFSSASAKFVTCDIKSGQVIYLQSGDSTIDTCYEIVSVDSENQLTISVLRGSETDNAIAVPTGTVLDWSITSYDPQARDSADDILQFFNIYDLNEDSLSIEQIINVDDLRRISVFDMLTWMTASIAESQEDSQSFWDKSLHYQLAYTRMRSKLKLHFDTDGDERVNHMISGGAVRLKRS